MDTLKLDNNNDLCLCSMENLAIVSGLQSIQQTAENKVKAVLNEMIFNYNNGVPYFQTAFSNNVNLPIFENEVRKQILKTDGVEKVVSVRAFIADDVLNYKAVFSTIYGKGIING